MILWAAEYVVRSYTYIFRKDQDTTEVQPAEERMELVSFAQALCEGKSCFRTRCWWCPFVPPVSPRTSVRLPRNKDGNHKSKRAF